MRATFILSAAAALMAAAAPLPSAAAANAPTASTGATAGDTVNSFTPAEQRRALSAARRAGYTAEGPVWAQAGYIFLTASRQGQRYQLTVAPDGAVYASTPVPATPAAAAAAPASR